MKKDFKKAANAYMESNNESMLQGFEISQTHGDCEEIRAVMAEMEILGARILEHGKTCKKNAKSNH